MVACHPLVPSTLQLFWSTFTQILELYDLGKFSHQQPSFPLTYSHMSWGKADCAHLSAIFKEDAFDDALNAAILKLHNTQLQLQQITHPNSPSTVLMLLTCFPIGRAVEPNNFPIMAHLDLKQKNTFNNPSESSSELCWLSKVHLENVHVQSHRIGGTWHQGGQDTEISVIFRWWTWKRFNLIRGNVRTWVENQVTFWVPLFYFHLKQMTSFECSQFLSVGRASPCNSNI